MQKVTIDVTEWNSFGNPWNPKTAKDFEDYNSSLFDFDGKCCLGFACLALGIEEYKLRDVYFPRQIEGATNSWMVDPDGENTLEATAAVAINDAPDKNIEEKMGFLITLFLSVGWDLQFE